MIRTNCRNRGREYPLDTHRTVTDYSAFSSGNCEVQCGQCVALMSISLIQNGHFLVVGAAGSSFLVPREVTLFTALSRQKRMKAMMMKFTTDAMNEDANPDTS